VIQSPILLQAKGDDICSFESNTKEIILTLKLVVDLGHDVIFFKGYKAIYADVVLLNKLQIIFGHELKLQVPSDVYITVILVLIPKIIKSIC
jgi:hypothetical protein